jgi:sulfate transport system ATP-binding protein
MQFVGEVNQVDGAYIRPHDLDLSVVPSAGADEVMVERVTKLGFEVRVQLALANGDMAWAQVTRAEAEELELEAGQIVYARPSRARVFDDANGPRTAELSLS